jgi:arsenate reductase
VNVLFVCVRNAGRSQMAEALFVRDAGTRHSSRSAGTNPAHRVHRQVATVLREIGIDISERIPRALSQADVEWADLVVTMGCGDACPVLPGKRYVEWALQDPAGRPLEDVRAIRDDVAVRVAALLDSAE